MSIQNINTTINEISEKMVVRSKIQDAASFSAEMIKKIHTGRIIIAAYITAFLLITYLFPEIFAFTGSKGISLDNLPMYLCMLGYTLATYFLYYAVNIFSRYFSIDDDDIFGGTSHYGRRRSLHTRMAAFSLLCFMLIYGLLMVFQINMLLTIIIVTWVNDRVLLALLDFYLSKIGLYIEFQEANFQEYAKRLDVDDFMKDLDEK